MKNQIKLSLVSVAVALAGAMSFACADVDDDGAQQEPTVVDPGTHPAAGFIKIGGPVEGEPKDSGTPIVLKAPDPWLPPRGMW